MRCAIWYRLYNLTPMQSLMFTWYYFDIFKNKNLFIVLLVGSEQKVHLTLLFLLLLLLLLFLNIFFLYNGCFIRLTSI